MLETTSFRHRKNYGPFNELLDNNGFMQLYAGDINEVTYTSYYNSLIAMMKDGIEHPYWQGQGKVRVTFTDGKACNLTLNDLFTNMIMWEAILRVGERIESKYLFMPKACNVSSISKYLNKHVVLPKKKIYSNRYLNNVLASCTDKFADSDAVAFYMADSICYHDDVLLMNKSQRYNELLHIDISSVPIDRVKDALTAATNEAIDIIQAAKELLGYNHCLASNFRTGEALNRKQFTETYIGLGIQADAAGNIIPMIISKAFITGALEDMCVLFIEAARARKALIYSHKNVSTTGSFARISKLCNMDTWLYPDPNFSCSTRNPIPTIIRDRKMLSRFIGRYFRRTKFGIEENITEDTIDIIGETIWLRSPMTCASHAAGRGICYRCYGDLAFTNSDINIGIMAAELLSSALTQRLLSAKHLLETKIKKIIWCDEFDRFFYVDTNKIMLNDVTALKGYKMIIKIDDLTIGDFEDDEPIDEDDEEGFDSSDVSKNNFCLTEFIVESPFGERSLVKSVDYDKMIASDQLNAIIIKKMAKVADEEYIVIDMAECEDHVFTVTVENSELTQTLGMINTLINKTSVTSAMTTEEMLQKFNDTLMEAGLDLCSVHAEVMIANQIVSVRDPYKRPSWQYENEPYKINAMSTQLDNNPSVAISLSYQDVPRQLYSAKTYKKTAPSQMDLFFVKHPQELLESVEVEPTEHETDEVDLYKFMRPQTIKVEGNPDDPNSASVRLNPFII